MDIFIDAGCAVSTPTCGPCLGGYMGILAEHERCVATTNRNFMIHIKALIIVERDTQKGIIIGHKGQALKKVGAMARKDIERFFDKKVFLEMFVKVEKDWRNRDNILKNFGYQLD